MDSAKTVGRIVGALLLAKLVTGPIQNFTLMGEVVAPPGFLVNAAAHPLHIPLAVMLAFALGLASIAIAVVSYPAFRRAAPMLALWFLALTLVGVATSLTESITTMSMLSLSQAYAAANGATPELYEGLRLVVGKTRNWAHYTNLLVGGSSMFVMFLLLFRATLVPRLIAGFGMAATLLQMYSIGLPFFGGVVDFQLLMPLGIAYLALCAWLLWKGLRPLGQTTQEGERHLSEAGSPTPAGSSSGSGRSSRSA